MANRDRFGLSKRDQGGLMPFGGEMFTSPFSVMRRMAEEMNQLMSAGVGGVNNLVSSFSGFPSVDVRETAGSFVVEAELPGVNPQDVDVQVQGDNLVIRGQSQRSNESQDQGYYMSERHYGSFYREIPLPGQVDLDNTTAHFENGVLEVRLPKTEQSSGRRIQVSGQGQMAGAKGGASNPSNSADNPNAIPSGENAVSQSQVESSPENQGWPGENQSGLSAEQEAQAFTQDQGTKGGQVDQQGQNKP